MPLFKFPVCWVVSDTQTPNEEYAGKGFEEKCQASRWIPWWTLVEEVLGNLVWGTTQSTYGCTSPPGEGGPHWLRQTPSWSLLLQTSRVGPKELPVRLGSPPSPPRSWIRGAESFWALAELGKGAHACGISRAADFTGVVNYKLMFVIVVCFLLKDRLQSDIKKQQEIIMSLRNLLLQVSAWHKQVWIFLLPPSLSFPFRKKWLFLCTAERMSIWWDQPQISSRRRC